MLKKPLGVISTPPPSYRKDKVEVVNTLLCSSLILQTLNCQALNKLCLCLSCSIFVLQSQLSEFSAILSQQQNDTRLGWFRAKKRPGTRTITNSGQLQNNCPLFVWENQDKFMQSVINYMISFTPR